MLNLRITQTSVTKMNSFVSFGFLKKKKVTPSNYVRTFPHTHTGQRKKALLTHN